MKNAKQLLAALAVLVSVLNGQPLPKIESSLDSSLTGYVSSHLLTPEQYVLSKFEDHDIVFLGEFHKFKQNLDLLNRLIPLLYQRGVYTLGYEFARREDQHLIDSLLSSPVYDERLARRIMFQEFVHWPFQEYIDVYKAAWELNHSLPKEKRKFRILGVNSSPDWSLIKKPEDRDSYQVMSKVWKGEADEAPWGQVLLDSVVAKGEKALVYSGTHHAFTEYRQPKVYQGKFIEWGEMRMGNAVFQRIGKKAITIVLHSPWYSAKGWDAPWVFPADGYLDAFFTEHPSPRGVGFDTKGTPFGTLPGETSIYKFGYERFMLETFCDGYIYMCPFSEYRPVTLIEGFVNDTNVEEARLRSPDPGFRSASVEEFRKDAQQDLDFQKRLPKPD
jgi:hypothetical protein